MNSIKVSPSSLVRPILKNVQPKRPCPTPMRPLPYDHFRPPRGQKQVFLPSFVITFLRTPHRPPNYATFRVPLWFSKLDLKDYLYNLYNLQTLRIRSYVIQARVHEFKPKHKLGSLRRQFFRAQSRKKMTVELVTDERVEGQGVFVWPAKMRDKTPWLSEQFRTGKEAQRKEQENEKEVGLGRMWPEGMKEVGGKARELLKKAGRE